MKSRICFVVAFITAVLCITLLALRNDSEIIAFGGETNQPEVGNAFVDIEVPLDSRIHFTVCLPEDRSSELPEATSIHLKKNGLFVLDKLELIGPRPFELPVKFAKKNHLAQRMVCGTSEQVFEPLELATSFQQDLNETEILALNDIPKGALVFAGVSVKHGSSTYMALFAAFLLSLWAGFAFRCSEKHKLKPHFRRYDWGIAFVGALICSLIFSVAITVLGSIDLSNALIPSYSELLALMASNFVAFLFVAAIMYVWRTKRKSLENTDENEDQADSVRKYNPLISLGLGFGLAICAALSLTFAPQPGITTIELASNFISTLFMSGIFAVLAGVSEECLFRGVIQSSLEARPGARHPLLQNSVAIGIASLLFVLLHVEQSLDHLWALIPIASVSIVSGVLKVRYKSMSPSILLHMTYNATLLIPSFLI